MSTGILAFLLGLYVVPLVLLWMGQHLRRRSALQQRAFWGAVVGHCSGATLAMTVGLMTPETWSPDDTWRGLLGLWAMLALPIVGGLAGAAFGFPRR